ncbi:MAG TPA: autotransporter-associated beta strand repeat-containing protein [Tepidisphaeraceae bacterium]|nr:autotransporter-associated beta strand repeat-containing protein [Tepidisphaeraceae bacterium]
MRLQRPSNHLITRCVCALAFAPMLAMPLSALAQNYSEWAFPGAGRRLDYKVRTDTNLGDRLPDFSMVGYGAGLRTIPSGIPVVIHVDPISGDNTQNIQNAINFAASLPIQANGFRGVVELGPGKFNVNSQININATGIVLRGAGTGDDLLTNTQIVSQNRSGSLDNAIPVIRFAGSTSGRVYGAQIDVTDTRVPVGAMSFNVASTAGLSVGRMVEIFRPSTQAWVDALGMNGIWGATDRNLKWQRTITRIEGNKVYLDAPITTAIDKQWSTGTIRTYDLPGQIHNVGIENLRGQSLDLREETNEARAWSLVEFSRVADGFMRNVEARHFPYAAVYVKEDDGTQYITVDGVVSRLPSGQVTGGRRYTFAIDGQMSLVQNGDADDGRHDFVTGSNVNGPIVFFKSKATHAHADSGPHHRWGNGLLFDNLNIGGELNIRNRLTSGSGHGWAGANSIVWNTVATRFAVQNPPTAQSWLIGSGPPFDDMWFGPQPRGIYDSTTQRVSLGDAVNNPLDSLYIAQLLERQQYHVDQRFWTGVGGSSSWAGTNNGWSNWSNKLTYNTNVAAPGPMDDVIFNIKGSTSLTTTPGVSTSIASLQFDATSAPVTVQVNNTTSRLTIGQRGVTVFSGSHNIVGTAGGSGAVSDITLAGDQTWEIRGTSSLAVNARFRESQLLSLWEKEGSGTLELRASSGGSNSLKVKVMVNEGVLRITNGGALGHSGNPITVADGAALELSNIGNLAQVNSDITLAGMGRGGGGALRHLSGSSRIGTGTGTGQVILASPQTGIGVDGGELEIDPPINGSGGLVKGGAGNLVLGGQMSYGGGTSINSGVLAIRPISGLGETALLNSLTISGAADTWQARLDLGVNRLIVRNADVATITNQIRDGQDGSGGIIAGISDPNLRLAAIRNGSSGAPLYTDFGGVGGLSGGEVLVKEALIGDLNFDNIVSISDFIDLSAHFGQSNVTWRDGDLNYDNQVSINDFIDLAAHFGQSYSGGAVGAMAVPEPGAWALGAIAATWLGRRRNKNAASGCACGRYAQDRI